MQCPRTTPLNLQPTRRLWPVLCLAGNLIVALLALFTLSTERMAAAQPPGPELFAKEPNTPIELWDAVDYLLRTDQTKKALPYLNRFIQSKPDDATLIAIRERFGAGSILRLSDDPVTRSFAQPLAEAMLAATRKYATRPERVAHFISELRGTPEEQEYAVRHLRQGGPYVIPPLLHALAQPRQSANDRTLVVRGIGRLDRSVIPPLAAALKSPDPAVAADAATALGLIGDQGAMPSLAYPATAPTSPPILQGAAQAALRHLTGQPAVFQLQAAVHVLVRQARRYHRHQVELGDDPVTVWDWNDEQKNVVPREVSRSEAEAIIGLQLANEALKLAPESFEAKLVQQSITLEKAVERVGFSTFAAQDQPILASIKASGPEMLTAILKTAIADGKTDLAAAAVIALGQVTDRAALSATGQVHPLVDALYAPGRRVQFAAAKAITVLTPRNPFPGSSRVVSTLGRFLFSQSLPRAVVIDSNPNRGSQLIGFLINLGYDTELAETGNRGFQAATGTADIELILISFDLFRPGWSLGDTLAHLQADARTAAVPIVVYGPLNVQYMRPNLEHDYPGIRFLVQPGDVELLRKQLKHLPIPLTDDERSRYARDAALLLAQISLLQKGPLTDDLPSVEPAVTSALNRADTAEPATSVLGRIPDPNAQRSLATVVLDPARPQSLRRKAAVQLVASIHRFGCLVTATQEARFAAIGPDEGDPELHGDIAAIIQALSAQRQRGVNRPSSRRTGPSQPRDE